MSFGIPAMDMTSGLLAVPPKSPASCIFPFTKVVASTIVPVGLDSELDPAAALFSTYFLTAYCVGYKVLLGLTPPRAVSEDLLE